MKANIDGMICKKIFFRKKRYNTVKKTAYGDNLTLNTVEATLSIKIYGKSVQETVPGNQLLDLPDGEVLSSGTLKAISQNGVVHVSGTPSADTLFPIKGGYNNTTALFTLPIGTYTAHGGVYFHSYDGTNRKVLSGTFTVTEETLVTCVFIKHSGNTFTAGTTYDLTIYPMLNKGSTPLPWEPYTGGITIPSHDNPSEIKSVVVDKVKACGKNLLIKNSALLKSSMATGNISRYMKKGVSYTFSCVSSRSGAKFRIYLKDENKKDIKFYDFVFDDNNVGKATVTPSQDVYYVDLYFIKDSTTDEVLFSNIQLEEGKEATAFEPYTENSITLSQPIELNGIGDVMDELTPDGVVRKFGFKEFTSAKSQMKQTDNDAKYLISFGKIADMAVGDWQSGLCNMFINKGVKADGSIRFGANDNIIYCYSANDTFASIESANAFLAENPITVLYELATPIIEPLPEADQIALRSLHSYAGVTHVMCDAEMEVEYVESASGDPYVLYKKMYIDGKLVYSAGNPVTYVVDSGVQYTEEVDFDASCLSPKTFTPTLDGWEFVGWRDDESASGDVLSSKAMGDSPITLYAVYSKSVTLSYNGNGSTGGSTDSHEGTAYRNYKGDVIGASFKLNNNGFSRGGYNFTGWNLGAVGASISIDANTTAYAQWTLALPHTLLSAYDATPSDPHGRFSVSAPTAISGSLGTGYRAWKNQNADGDGDYNFSCSFKFTIYNHTSQAVVAVVSVSEDEYESTWATGGGNYNIAANSSVTVTVSGGGSGNTNPDEYCRVSARCDSIVIKSA